MLMAEEPNYSKVAARMLSESIRKEVGRDLGFRDYVKDRDRSGAFSMTTSWVWLSKNFQRSNTRFGTKRDDLFEYFGLKTVADRYLLRHPESRTILERPQWLFMRVALGLSQSVLKQSFLRCNQPF